MKTQQKRAGQSTREMAAIRHKRRIWFSILTVAIVLLIMLVALNPKLLKVGGIGSLGLLIFAQLIMKFSDVKDKRMRKEEKRAIRGAGGRVRGGEGALPGVTFAASCVTVRV